MVLGSIRCVMIFLAMSLQGCMPAFLMKNSVEFNLYDNMHAAQAIYKNNWPSCAGYPAPKPGDKYITAIDDCKVKPDGYVPKEIVIEYAPWLTYPQQEAAGLGNARSYFKLDDIDRNDWPPMQVLKDYNDNIDKKIISEIDKIPANAWKKIVLHPQELVEQYKSIKPKGRGVFSEGKVIEYNIGINADGSYEISHRLLWKRPISTLVHD